MAIRAYRHKGSRLGFSVGLALLLVLALFLAEQEMQQTLAHAGAVSAPVQGVDVNPKASRASVARAAAPSAPAICSGDTDIVTEGTGIGISNQPSSNWEGDRVALWSTSDLATGNGDGNVEIFLIKGDDPVAFTQATVSSGTILGGFNLSPSINREGDRIAFFSDRDLDEDEEGKNRDGNFEIFVAQEEADGTLSIQQITETKKRSNLLPSISHDGRLIAFASDFDHTGNNADENQEIFVAILPEDGSGATIWQITDTPAPVINDDPALSGNGNFVAYTSNRRGSERFDVYRAPVTATLGISPTRLSDPAWLTGAIQENPTIDESGSHIAFASQLQVTNTSIFLASLNGREGWEVKPLTPSMPLLPTFSQYPSISGDGTRIAFVSNGDWADAENDQQFSQIFIYDLVTETFEQLTRNNGEGEEITYSYPTLSGNGVRIMFASNSGGNRHVSRIGCPYADLGIPQVISSTNITAGTMMTYQVVITNTGPNAATGVSVRHELSPGTVFEDEGTDWRCGQVSCTLESSLPYSIAAGGSISHTFHITVSPWVTEGTPITNLLAVSSREFDRDDTDNSYQMDKTITARSYLLVEKQGEVDEVDLSSPNRELTYVITVANDGPSASPDIQVVDRLPPFVRFLDASDQGRLEGNQVIWPTFTLRPHSEPHTLTVQVEVTDTLPSGEDDITNRVQARDARGDRALTTEVTRLKAQPELRLSVDDGESDSNPGQVVTYAVTLGNPRDAGSHQGAANLVLTTTLPAHTTFISATPGYTLEGQVLTWTLRSLAVDEEYDVEVTVQNAATFPAGVDELVFHAGARDDGTNSNTAGELIRASASDTTTLNASPGFTLTNSDSRSEISPGNLLTYQILLTNTGTQEATGVEVTDTLPPTNAATFISASGNVTPTGNRLRWTLPSLGVGQTASFTVTVRAATAPVAAGINEISNEVTVTDDGSNSDAPVTADATDVTTLIAAPQLSLINSNSLDAVLPEAHITSVFTIVNSGTQDAAGVVLTSTLPAHTTPTDYGDGTYDPDAHHITWILDTLPVGPVVTRTVALDVAAIVPATTLVNVAVVRDGASNGSPAASATMTDTDTVQVMLGDRVWEDLDGKGTQSDGEPGVAGVTVALMLGNTEVTTTTTNSLGEYQLGPLNATPHVSYTLRFTPPPTYSFTLWGDGSAPTIDSDANPATGETDPFTLFPARRERDLDAGLYRFTTVDGLAWYESDGDGIHEPPSEGGLPNIAVTLLATNGSLTLTTTTLSDGTYNFTNLPPGNYRLEFTDPDGRPLTQANQEAPPGNDQIDSDPDPLTGQTDDFDVVSGTPATDWDAGYTLPSQVTGRIWEDLDGDGLQDGNENNLTETVTVELRARLGNLFVREITTNDGTYALTNLPPLCYYLTVSRPAGYNFSPQNQTGVPDPDNFDSDVAPATGRSGDFCVGPLLPAQDIDAGLYLPATVGDYVWEDMNGNGIQDAGDEPLAGATVSLHISVTEPPLRTATTASDGLYLFSDLAPGTYYLKFSRSGYQITLRNQGGANEDSDPYPATGWTGQITLESDENDSSWDAGFYRPITVGDKVVYDTNANGILESGEQGIPGITVKLYNLVTGASATQNTTSGGSYSFTNLPPGSYYLEFTPPATQDYLFSPANVGDDEDVDSDANPDTGRTEPFLLTSGTVNNSQDAGLYILGQISGAVFHDVNGDGTWTSGNPGVPNVRVSLYDSSGPRFLAETFTEATPPNLGFYSFNAPAGGEYYLIFDPLTLPSDRILTWKDRGNNEGIDSDADPITGRTDDFILPINSPTIDVDAGITEPASVGDRVWNDTSHNGNDDGYQNPEENGRSGVRVRLIRVLDNMTVGDMNTDSNGLYRFTNLLPGDYYLRFNKPNDFKFSQKDQNGGQADDTTDSDVRPTSGRTDEFRLDPGEDTLDWDAGMYYCGNNCNLQSAPADEPPADATPLSQRTPSAPPRAFLVNPWAWLRQFVAALPGPRFLSRHDHGAVPGGS